MCSKRGALIVLEGCDRAGKSTQATMLMEALCKMSIPTTTFPFPDRTTRVGMLIHDFLAKQINMPPEAAHLLFSANRWENKAYIEKTLLSGMTLVVDRYVSSGAAYAAANTGRSLNWCKQPDLGLPKPDCVVFLKVSKRQQEERLGWGQERFEKDELQARVSANYEQLMDDTWITVDTDRIQSAIHSDILSIALSVIKEVQFTELGVLK